MKRSRFRRNFCFKFLAFCKTVSRTKSYTDASLMFCYREKNNCNDGAQMELIGLILYKMLKNKKNWKKKRKFFFYLMITMSFT